MRFVRFHLSSKEILALLVVGRISLRIRPVFNDLWPSERFAGLQYFPQPILQFFGKHALQRTRSATIGHLQQIGPHRSDEVDENMPAALRVSGHTTKALEELTIAEKTT